MIYNYKCPLAVNIGTYLYLYMYMIIDIALAELIGRSYAKQCYLILHQTDRLGMFDEVYLLN